MYDDEPNYLREPRWHVWNIELAEFNDVNLANIKRITIGFGDGNQAENDSIMYFENILLGCGKTEFINYDGSVYLDEDPFVNGYDSYPLLLKQDCPLIDAGGDYIDDQPHVLGKTTAWEGTPDNNVADIGFHYFNWYYANAGERSPADLDDSNTVDLRDFVILADGWETTYDINDLKIMADEWLEMADPNIQLQIYDDYNNGFTEVGVSGYLSNTQRVFLLIDGEYVDEILWFRKGGQLDFDASTLGAGTHQIKVVSINTEGHVTCSKLTENTFNCFLNYCFCPKAYEPNKPLYFYGIYSGGGDLSVKAFEHGEENPVWSDIYSSGDLSSFIPSEITEANDIDYVIFEEIPSGRMVDKPTESIFNPPKNTRALLILPVHSVNRTNNGVIKAVKDTFKSRGVPLDTLGCWGSSYERIKWCAENCNINYIYYTGHGDFNYLDASGRECYRTHIEIDDGELYSFKPSSIHGGFDLYKMGFQNIKFAFFDCCWTGHLVYKDDKLVVGKEGFWPWPENIHNDMSKALRMDSEGNHFFQGWYSPRPTGMIDYKELPNTKNPYHYFCLYEWEKLQTGASLKAALDHAIWEVSKLIYGEDARDNIRTKGQQYIWEVTID